MAARADQNHTEFQRLRANVGREKVKEDGMEMACGSAGIVVRVEVWPQSKDRLLVLDEII
jgi:hypothetical protein